MKNISILFLFMNLFCAIGADFHLVENQHPAASIVLMEKTSDSIKKSIENFNLTLKTITGTELPVVRETSGNQILFSVNKINSLNTADFFTISFPDSRTMLIECTEISIQWAFNHLIREYAKAEWILPESCGLSYTPMQNLVIPARKIEVKDISWPISRVHSVRTIWWMQNLRMGLRIGHDLTRHVFPAAKYGKDNSWPKEILPVLNGKKITALPNPKFPEGYWQPCYSNPETAKIAVKNLLEYLEKHPETIGLSMGTNDNNGFCECAECLKLDKNNRYNRSESYFTFINRVLDEVCKKHPKLLVSVFAYTLTYNPPSFKLHPNAVVYLTIDFNSCADPKLMERHKKIIADWGRKASMIGVWDYSWGYPYPVPRLYAPYHLDMLKFMFEHNAKAYFGESWTCDAHEGPKHYLLTKLLWDSRQNMKKLEEEWYIRCVGKKAAPHLNAYYKIWNDYFTGPATKTPWWKSAPSVYMTYNDVSCIYALREEDIQAADRAMKQVVALAETEQEKQRAELLMRHWRYTFLRLRLLGAGVYDPQGFIHTPKQALKLLEYVSKAKVYQQEYDRIGEILSRDRNIRPYYLSKAYLREGGTPVGQKYDNAVKSHILAASKFASDPAVGKELKRLTADPEQPEMVRQLCTVMADLDAQENLLPDGDAENGIKAGYEIHPQLRWGGSLSVSGKHKAEGEKSFMVSINGHDTCFWILAKAKPKTSYLAMFRAFIPESSAEGYLNAALYGERNGINLQWRNLPQLKLSGGVWQTFSVMTTTPQNADSVRLRIWLKEFEVGDEIYIDDIRLIELGKGASRSVRKKPVKSKPAGAGPVAAAPVSALVTGELPQELAGIPKEEIKDVSRYIYGTRADDPEAPANGKTVVFKPVPGAKNLHGVLMGVYDKAYHKATKQVIGWSRHKIPDEKYHWYKIRRISKNAEFQGVDRVTVYLENWKIGARLPKSFKGKYDCWVQIRAQGPYYVDGSDKENMLFLNRVLLVPIKQ